MLHTNEKIAALINNTSFKLHNGVLLNNLYHNLILSVVHDILDPTSPNRYIHVLVLSRLMLDDRETSIGCISCYYSDKPNTKARKVDKNPKLLDVKECSETLKRFNIRTKNHRIDISNILPESYRKLNYQTLSDFKLNNPSVKTALDEELFSKYRKNYNIINPCCLCHLYCINKLLTGELYLRV